MKKAFAASAAVLASASAALANPGGSLSFNNPTPVPEISALEGTAAIAALAAIVLFAWERRRRAS